MFCSVVIQRILLTGHWLWLLLLFQQPSTAIWWMCGRICLYVCGKQKPTSSVSLHCCYLLFSEDYRVVGGSRRWGTSCTYDFFSTDDVTSGRFFSEKFPQNYPPSASCSYVFVSAARQVIAVTFDSIRLANGRRPHHHFHRQQQQQQQGLDDSRSVWGQHVLLLSDSISGIFLKKKWGWGSEAAGVRLLGRGSKSLGDCCKRVVVLRFKFSSLFQFACGKGEIAFVDADGCALGV